MTKQNEGSTVSVCSLDEMKAILGIGRNKAYKLLKDGKISGWIEGNTWKVRRDSIEQYINDRCSLMTEKETD